MILEIFPEGGLANSVTTAVWVGVFVVVSLNMRFGTTLSGMVIPGYLVPIFFIKPVSACVVLVEGGVTYILTLLLAQLAMVRFGYNELFGRDRFFALIVVSVFVRMFFDYWALPVFGEWLTGHGWTFDYRNNLHSFGLIIVSLIANQFWNSGLKSGVTVLIAYLGLTYLLIGYLLIPFTNFNIAEIGYMYEDMAKSLLASPKAYIILITTAFIASRMNLFYGWEFNGILIPALLALQWYQPEKLLFTLVETLIILVLAYVIMRLPRLSDMSFEGSRLLFMFFNIGFVYKILLGYFLIQYFPTKTVSDYYGFGYLVSTLLAMKMYKRDLAVHITRATLQTSLIAVFIASLIGFALTLLPQTTRIIAPSTEQGREKFDGSLQEFYTIFRPALYRASVVDYYSPSNSEEDIFREAWQSLQRFRETKQPVHREHGRSLLNSIEFDLTLLEQRYLVISDQKPERGWGLYVLNLEAMNELFISVPDGLVEKYTDVLALRMMNQFQARTVAISTSRRDRSVNGSSDVLEYPVNLFQQFHRINPINNVLQLRGYNQSLKRQIGGQNFNLGRSGSLGNVLWVKNKLPQDLAINTINDWLDQLDVRISPAPFDNLQRELSQHGFAELLLSPEAIKRLLNQVGLVEATVELRQARRLEGYLQSWLLNNKSLLARRGSESYQKPDLGTLLYWENEILLPVLALADQHRLAGWNESSRAELNRLSDVLSAYNYQLLHYVELGQDEESLILSERPGADMRNWGSLIIRLGNTADYLIEVPHPLFERSSFEFSVSWFSRLNARYLLLAGSHPYANKSGEANMSQLGNNGSIFQLAHQVIQRQANNPELLPLQIRGLSTKPGRAYPSQDLQLSFWQHLGVPAYPLTAGLLYRELQAAGMTVSLYDGDFVDSPFAASRSQQASYSNISASGAFAVLSISPKLQHRYQHKAGRSQVRAQVNGANVETLIVDVKSWLVEQPRSKIFLQNGLIKTLMLYQLQQDVLTFMSLRDEFPAERLKLLLDLNSGQEFFALFDSKSQLIGLFNPGALNGLTVVYRKFQDAIYFIDQRDSLLVMER